MISNYSRTIISLVVILIAVSIVTLIIDRKNDKRLELENTLNDLNAPSAGDSMSVSEEQAALKNLSAPSDKSLLSEEDEARALKSLQK